MNFDKILFVGHKNDTNSPDYGLVYNSFYTSLKNLSKNLKPFFYEDYNKKERDQNLIKIHKQFNPDLVIFIYQLGELDFETLMILKNTNSTTVNFYGDDCWRFNTFTLKTHHLFDVIVSFDESKKIDYEKHNISNVIFSQWGGISKFAIQKVSNEFDYEVSFIGAKTELRDWIIKKLKKNGVHVECFGKGWPNGIIHFEEMKKIISKSKINLDLQNSISYDIRFLSRYPRGLYRVIKNFFSNKLKQEDGIKARIFEVTSMGGLLLTYFNPNHSNYFNIGKEIYCYNNIDNIIEIIKIILMQPEESNFVRFNGHKRSISDHLYENRMKAFFKDLRKIRK